MSYWKVLRVLVTDVCNYKCIYCHNEGQQEKNRNMLDIKDFIKIIQSLEGTGLNEIRFSGGEPFANKQVVQMIKWACENTSYEIGCATNGQLLNEEIIRELSKTQIKLTIHYPSNNLIGYKYITDGDYDIFIRNLDLLDKYKIEHSFNFVLYPELYNEFDHVLEGVQKRNKGLKILPYIDNDNMNISNEIIDRTREKMNNICISNEIIDDEGIEIWYLENNLKIKLLHSPCYGKNIKTCREYGEVRLLPTLKLQKCILDNKEHDLNMENEDSIRKDFQKLWDSFTKCYQTTIEK